MNQDLVSRIQHPLASVSERAIESLLFKLKTGLLKSSDICHQHNVIDSILSNLNSTSPSLIDAVLFIINILASNPSSAKYLVDHDIYPRLARLNHQYSDQINNINTLLISNDATKYSKAYSYRSASPEPALKQRSSSPFKIPSSYCPPNIPNAFQTFEYVYLGPLDKEIVHDFNSLLGGLVQVQDDKLESTLFSVIIVDFGAQVFLQSSFLFRVRKFPY